VNQSLLGMRPRRREGPNHMQTKRKPLYELGGSHQEKEDSLGERRPWHEKVAQGRRKGGKEESYESHAKEKWEIWTKSWTFAKDRRRGKDWL